MYKNRLIAFLLIFLTFTCLAQEKNYSLEGLEKSFSNFEYSKTVLIADSLLTNKNVISKNDLIEIYRVKAISHYSLLEINKARNSFVDILNIEPTFQLDSLKTSPKIIAFFNDIKNTFLKDKEVISKAGETAIADSVKTSQEEKISFYEEEIKSTMARSLILPGLGHLYLGKQTKGIILTSISVLSLSSLVYFVVDANNKENDYLSASSLGDIQTKYDAYNKSYHLRNISIITFAAVWLYSQIDLLFFTHYYSPESDKKITISPVSYRGSVGLNFHLKF